MAEQPNTQKAKAAIRLIAAMLEVVQDMEEQGAPSGPMYLAWMTQGGSLDGYQTFMTNLVEAGALRHAHNCYFITPEGRKLVGRLKDIV
jgi:hypothetical protein